MPRSKEGIFTAFTKNNQQIGEILRTSFLELETLRLDYNAPRSSEEPLDNVDDCVKWSGDEDGLLLSGPEESVTVVQDGIASLQGLKYLTNLTVAENALRRPESRWSILLSDRETTGVLLPDLSELLPATLA